MSASLSIIVYKGEPIDAPDYRHTALFLDTPGNESVLLHVVGGAGFFQPQIVAKDDPAASVKFVSKIEVAKIHGQSKDSLQSTIMATPVKNTDRFWNCQHWVGDALLVLSKTGWISSAARKKAVDDMVDVIVDAPDES